MLPLNYAILRLFLHHDELDADAVMTALGGDYGRSRQFRRAAIVESLMTAEVNGLLEEASVSLGADQQLVITYRATESGRAMIGRFVGA